MHVQIDFGPQPFVRVYQVAAIVQDVGETHEGIPNPIVLFCQIQQWTERTLFVSTSIMLADQACFCEISKAPLQNAAEKHSACGVGLRFETCNRLFVVTNENRGKPRLVCNELWIVRGLVDWQFLLTRCRNVDRWLVPSFRLKLVLDIDKKELQFPESFLGHMLFNADCGQYEELGVEIIRTKLGARNDYGVRRRKLRIVKRC